MAKKYYWLKLKNDFFKSKAMKKLRRIAGGDTYTIIYLKLQLLSLQDEGKLFFENIEDSFSEELALEIDEDPDNVRFTLLFLEQCGLLEYSSEDEIMLNEVPLCIGKESDSAERVRRYREKKNQKALQCNGDVTTCNTEKEKEKEKEKELEKELEKEVKRIDYTSIVNMYNETCVSFSKVQALSDARKKAIKSRLNTYTIDDFKTLFEKAEASDFLKGKNNRDWQANFDWLIKDANMAKVLDGNYDNKPTVNSSPGNTFNQTQGFYRNDSKEALEASYKMYAEWAEGE